MLAGALLTGLAACSGDPEPPKPSPSATPTKKPELTFGVFGPEAEVAAFTEVADQYASANDVSVDVVSYSSSEAAARAYRAGGPPDVFLLSQRDLAPMTAGKLLRPVDELLDERGVSFGDTYSRDALEAFAVDNSLTCIPYAVSPMVIYYNTDLIDFPTMVERGLDAPEPPEGELPTGWNFDQFTAAAEFATRPRRDTRGVYIDSTLAGLSPFIYAGGGKVFDDKADPTSLAFSDDSTRSALETTLPLLRDAQVTPTAKQLAGTDATTLFEEGKLGMIAGYRSLVPRLRAAPGLHFDVMPMPSIKRTATVGDVTGLCMSADTEEVSAAANFLVSVLSDESVAQVVRQGYTVPANVKVASSDDFLQPGREPANAAVFRTSVRRIEIPPLLDSWSDLENAVADSLRQLVTVPVLDEETMNRLTEQIDLDSQTVLSPPEESPSDSPSGTPSDSPSASGS
ncbi:ABC transporter substrate-binding protein [Nocardioides sp.]|uniref:ABC transporter substrate-binding protein n=1 Tax=Nocardioides sp. TaxID=35761 RepID=UPI0035277E57